VTIDERVVYGELEPFTIDSNEIPLLVIPRITSTSSIDGLNNRITLTLVDFIVDFEDGTDDELDIQLIVDGKTYLRDWTPPANGRFVADGPNSLTFQALFNVSATGDHPCRVVVNGAESAPFWIEIP
jgi:hypothetical protein